jgi:methylmalonyl-CoA mutase C-terminal domain/subunit
METAKKEKVRALFTRHVFEGHDIGLRTIVNRCKESGIEVIYYPRFKEFDEVVKIAEEEDVNLIGISSSTGAHLYLSKGLISKLKEKSMVVPVIVGGIIPDKDTSKLKEMGIAGVFGPGSHPEEVASFILKLLEGR